MVIDFHQNVVQNLLLGQLCIVQVVCDMDDEQVSDPVHSHLGHRQ